MEGNADFEFRAPNPIKTTGRKDVTIDEPLSPMARLFHRPGSSLYIMGLLGTKTLIDPDHFKAGISSSFLALPRFSSLQVTDNEAIGEVSAKMRWVKTEVDIENHVFFPKIDSEETAKVGVDKFVEDYTRDLTGVPLDMSKPLWDVHVLNLDKMTSKGAMAVALFRFHHSIGDGTSIMSLFMSFTRKSADPNALPALPVVSKKGKKDDTSGVSMYGKWLSFLRLLWNTLVDILNLLATAFFLDDTPNPLKGPNSAGQTPRRILISSVRLEDIKLVKNITKATLNDVVMGVIEAGLSRYLNRRYGEMNNGKKVKKNDGSNNLPPLALAVSARQSLSPSPRQSVRRSQPSSSLNFNTHCSTSHSSTLRLTCSAAAADKHDSIRTFTCGILAVWAVTSASPVIAANQIMAISHSSSSSEDDHNDTSDAVPKKRGVVYMSRFIKRHKAAGTKATVEWNSRGNPIGKVADNWRNYLGVLVRCRVPIIHTDWRKVPKHFKDNVWREATAIFDGVEEHKNQELSDACKMWKQFKSRLTQDYIYGDGTDEDALKMYPYIDSNHWKTFKEQRLSEAAKKLSDTNKDLVKKNVYKHVLGRGGYRKLEEAMAKEKIAELISQGAIQEEQASNVSIERHDLWKRGRIRKNAEFVSEASQGVATKIDDLVEKAARGEFSSQGRRDILTEAIGTDEHPGRTRGLGSHIPWRIGLPSSTSSRATPSSSAIRIQPSDRQSEYCFPAAPTDTDPWKNIPKIGLRSLLYIEEGLNNERRLVAVGRVMNGRLLRAIPLPDEMVKVKVDSALGQIVGLPIPHGEKLKTTRDAQEKSDFVAWPKHLIENNPREYTMRLYYHLPPASNEEVENYSIDCRFLHDIWTNLGRTVVNVRIADELFGDDYTSIVGPDDVRDIYNLEPLSNSHCDLYISSLYNQILESEIRFGFFNHTAVSPSNDINDRLESFVSRLHMPDKDRNYCYFMPYINAAAFHWMLCVIFPNQGVVHWLNSLEDVTVIHSDAKALVDSGLQRYYQGCNLRIDRHVEWKIVTCPKQPKKVIYAAIMF